MERIHPLLSGDLYSDSAECADVHCAYRQWRLDESGNIIEVWGYAECRSGNGRNVALCDGDLFA
ncbi:hypothetical protein D3C73_503910 [compost metagenome]